MVTFDLLGRQVVVAGGDEGASGGVVAGQGSLFVPSASMPGVDGTSGEGPASVGIEGQQAAGGLGEGPLLEGPLRAVVNPTAHVAPTFTTPSAAQLARVAVPR